MKRPRLVVMWLWSSFFWGQRESISTQKVQFNRTPLWLAASNGHEMVVRLLSETGEAELNKPGWFHRIV